MSEENEPIPKSAQEVRSAPDSVTPPPDPHYYVENVSGDDFTFYISAADNHHLIPDLPPAVHGPDQRRRKKFSSNSPLRVTTIPSPLLRGTDVLAARNFLKLVYGPKPIEGLSELPKRTKSQSSKKQTKVVLTALNDWLLNDNQTSPVIESESDPVVMDPETLASLGDRGLRARKKRKWLDRHLQGTIKPFKSELADLTGRSVICRSYRGDLLSVSFRQKSLTSSWEPDGTDKYLLNMKKYCDTLYEALKVTDMRGLLVITGATNSGKSEIATGLIYKYLEQQVEEQNRDEKRKRRPHLVTFEEPIEKYYATPGYLNAPRMTSVEMTESLKKGVDYTPRERGDEDGKSDVASLREALKDALRQTPKVLFVGETREKEDWKELVDFAGTGHLIVTTAHAGSLTESMTKIFEAVGVKTPAQRSEIATRLLGIIHIRPHEDPDPVVLLPAMWRRTATGKHALTADGLSSLLPYRPNEESETEEREINDRGCLGRAWFANCLIARIGKGKLEPVKERVLRRNAIEWDLEGI